ncbi:MAG: RluA family pseudouridine synthase [Nitrospirae bacterium]|nr:RluA family pseudouridine synthase [Nitrospirota bacterium]
MNLQFTVSADDTGGRLDSLCAKMAETSRSGIQKLIEAGRVSVNGHPALKTNRTLRLGDVVSIDIPPTNNSGDELVPEPIRLEILFEDDHLIMVNKPAGLVVYPAAGHPRGTLMNALRHHCDHLASVGGPLRPGVVHRLDKDTSGVMVVAKTDEAYHHLRKQFDDRTITRRYLALVHGRMSVESGVIDAAIGRSDSDRKRMTTRTRHEKKQAVTHWRVIELFRGASLVEARLKTGRTHQIRVHFAATGHPVLGDAVYGKKTRVGGLEIPRQMLHAETLGIIHPATGEEIFRSVAPPADMAELVERLRGMG